MTTIFLFIFFLLLLLSIKVFAKDLVSKFSLLSFVAYWYISLIASTFSPYGLFDVSFKAYLLLILGTCSFVMGMIFFAPASKSDIRLDRESISQALDKLLESKALLISYILAIIYFAEYAVAASVIAAVQGHTEMEEQFDLIFQGNSLAQLLFGYIATPMLHLSFVLIAYAFIKIKGNFKKLIIPLIVWVAFFIENFIIAGGRSTILIAAMYFLLTYVYLIPLSAIKKLSLRKVILAILLVVVISNAFSYMNLFRTTGSFDKSLKEESEEKSSGGFFETLARYSLSPIVMFDRSLQYDYAGKFGYQYGKASLMGFDTWVAIGLRQVGIPYKTSSHITEYLEENYFQYDKNGTSTNYAYTGVFYHYMDFGIFGVVLFPFIFGLLYRKTIFLLYKRPSIYSFLLVGFGYFMMMHSLFTCYFIKSWGVLYIGVLYFLIYKKRETKIISKA